MNIPTMHMMVGNVGSGKSEMAKHLSKKYKAVIVNMDAIQESMHGFYGGYREEMKPIYRSVEEAIINGALSNGVDVVIDRTNMDKKRRSRFIDIAKNHGVEVDAYVMPIISVETLLERRMKNPRGMSESKWRTVIENMRASYEDVTTDEGIVYINKVEKYGYKFLACDFDGTIVGHEFPDIGDPEKNTISYLRKFWNESIYNRVIIWTCRGGNYIAEMTEWLRTNDVPYDYINENPLCDYGSPKIFANKYLDDRNILLSDCI